MIEPLDVMLKDRDNAYDALTKRMIRAYGDKLKQVMSFVVNYDREIQCLEIERYGTNSNVLYLKIMVIMSKGDFVPTETGLEEIIEDDTEIPVRLLVTANTLSTKEPLDVYEEIKRISEYEAGLSPEESYRLFCDGNFHGDLNAPEFTEYFNKLLTKTQEFKGFDVTNLTLEQKIQLGLNADIKETLN